MVRGTEGYEQFTLLFIETSRTLDFFTVCQDFITFLPHIPANILDVGSGAGQNAVSLASLGFNVTAIEPIQAFLDASKDIDLTRTVNWLKGSLPLLTCLSPKFEERDKFDFVLIDAVWHHLNEIERKQAMTRLSKIITTGGRCAISLRNGPAGIGSRVFTCDTDSTIKQFEKCGFECLFTVNHQASFIANKENVTWSRVVLQKVDNVGKTY